MALTPLDCVAAEAGPEGLGRVSSAPLRAFLQGLVAKKPPEWVAAPYSTAGCIWGQNAFAAGVYP